MKKTILSLVAFTMIGSAAYAEEISTQYTVGLNVGTVGIGLDISVPVTPSLNVRASLNGATYSGTEVESDIEYDYSGDLLTIGALLDYYPVEESQFYLSAGAFYNGNGIDGTGIPYEGTYEINGVEYQATDIGALDAEFDFNKIAPYIGLGWGHKSMEAGWGFSMDIGALYHGSPNAALDVTRGSGIPADDGGPNDILFEQIQADVEAEQKDLEDEISSYKWYPVVRIGLTYTF